MGGDKLDVLKANFHKMGATKIKHISGRKKGDLIKNLPSTIDLVVILTDFVNHQLCNKIKQEAHKNGIKTIYAKRSWSHIVKAF